MCWASASLRWALGIGPYRPGVSKRALQRHLAMRTGQRGNGTHGDWAGLTDQERRAIEHLAREHRIIAQAIADSRRRGT